MLLQDINPYIRYASKISIATINGCFKSKDYRLFYVNNANDTIKTGGKTFPFKTNCLFIIPAGIQYEFNITHTVSFTAINFDYSQSRRSQTEPFPPINAKENNLKETIYKETFLDLTILNEILFLENAKFISPTLEKILSLHQFSNCYSISKNSCLLKSLIIDIVEGLKSTNKHEDIIMQVYNYIWENYSNDISNQNIAEEFGFHPYYLNRVFFEHTGTTLHKYLSFYRIKEAEQLLISTNNSIKEIANIVGFNSPTVFIENFKRQNKITPSKYRLEYNNIYQYNE